MYKLLVDGTRRLKQCLISVITTAGFDLNAPCYALYQYCKNILEGVISDETQFVQIHEMDKDDDIWSPVNWRKSNPLWRPELEDALAADAVKAKNQQGEELRNFLTKALNMWVQFADNDYINKANWAACATDLTLEDMRGKSCFLGLDLSSGGDLTSGGLEIPFEVEGVRKTFIDSHSFIPANRVAEHIKTDMAPYDMWIKGELLTVTETLGGVKTDYRYIVRYYKELLEKYDLRLIGIGYDGHNADAFLSDLEEFGVDCTEVKQSCRSLNDATVDFRLAVDAREVAYNRKNELLTWSVVNANVVSNSFGEIKIDKDLARKRIDPVDAIIDAHKLCMAIDKENAYESRGIRMA